MKLCISPYCGALVDLDSVPNQHPVTGTIGKFCPITHQPLDIAAVENSYIDASGDVVSATKEGWLNKIADMVHFEFAGSEAAADGMAD